MKPPTEAVGVVTESVTKYTVLHDLDYLDDALSGYQEMYDTREQAEAAVRTWASPHDWRVVNVEATISELERNP